MTNDLSRRAFLATGALAAPLTALAATPTKASLRKTPPICVFSKHLQFLDYKALAKTCRELELDGVDLTVRKGGHVLPENVKRNLPAAVEAIRGEGLEVPMITTRFYHGGDADVRPVLETAASLGIRYFRVGGQKYDENGAILPQLNTFTKELRNLAAVAAEYDMTAGYHNHSGFRNVGAPLWDLHRMIEAIASPHLGSNFDVGHAAVEGGYGAWRMNARLMAPHVKMMAVKDFVWEKARPKWVPLGEGLVRTSAMLDIMRGAGFLGPISIHFEYRIRSDDAMIEEIRKAVVTLRKSMAKAGYVA